MLNSNFWSYFPEFTLLTQCWVLSTAKYCFFSTAITLLLLQWPDWKVQTDKYPWQVAKKYFSNIIWGCLNSDRSCYHTTLPNYGVMFTIIQPLAQWAEIKPERRLYFSTPPSSWNDWQCSKITKTHTNCTILETALPIIENLFQKQMFLTKYPSS